jgi:hypothetical protein
MKTRVVFYYGKFVVMGIAFVAIFTYAVMLLWNALVPELFNGPVINYWQTMGIFLLSKILFTGMGSNHKDGSSRKFRSGKHEHYKSHWKKKFEEKMNGRCVPESGQEDSGTTGDASNKESVE